MYIVNYPEDSTLRRHYESAAAFRRAAFAALPPTDSTLRRHFEQRLRATTGAATRENAAGDEPVSATAPAYRSAPPDVDSGGGILGWLKRLFS